MSKLCLAIRYVDDLQPSVVCPCGGDERLNRGGDRRPLAAGVVADPGSGEAVREALDATYAAVADRQVGRYPNFVEVPADASTLFYPDTWARLLQMKATYDPSGVFRGNHRIGRQSLRS